MGARVLIHYCMGARVLIHSCMRAREIIHLYLELKIQCIPISKLEMQN